MGNTDSCCRTRTQSITRIKDDRSCTDVLFLLLLAVCTGVMLFLTSDAIAQGSNPNEILRRVDMNGSICGEDLPDEPYAAWPNPDNWDAVVCLSDCSETNNPDNDKMSRLYSSSQFVTLCVPTFVNGNSTASLDSFFSVFSSPMQVATRSVATVNAVIKPIMMSAIGALVLSFLVTFVLQKTAGCFVWGCIALIAGGGLWLGMVMNGWATDSQDTLGDSNRATFTLYGSYVVWGATAVFILVVFAMRKQIGIGIEVVKEAGRAINDMKSIVFFPIVPFTLCAGYFLAWLVMGLNIMSVTSQVREEAPQAVLFRGPEFGLRAGTRNDNPADMVVQTRDEKWMYAGYFHIFMLIWTFQMLFYYGYHVFAGATADWYFSPGASQGHRRVGTAPLFRSAMRVLRYHMGTVAVCGLIIAVIKTIRAVVVYLEKKTKGTPPNAVQKAVFCALHCCLKCVECCMDKVNKNALIWQAVYGDSFGTACCSSFALVWRNLARVAALHVVSWLIVDLGKFAVALLTSGLFSYLIQKSGEISELSELGLPIFLVFCISLGVASMFFMIFQSVIDTTFFCFLIDCEANAGTGQMMASPGLKSLVQDFKEESKQEATAHQEKRIRRGADEGDTQFLGVVEMN